MLSPDIRADEKMLGWSLLPRGVVGIVFGLDLLQTSKVRPKDVASDSVGLRRHCVLGMTGQRLIQHHMNIWMDVGMYVHNNYNIHIYIYMSRGLYFPVTINYNGTMLRTLKYDTLIQET